MASAFYCFIITSSPFHKALHRHKPSVLDPEIYKTMEVLLKNTIKVLQRKLCILFPFFLDRLILVAQQHLETPHLQADQSLHQFSNENVCNRQEYQRLPVSPHCDLETLIVTKESFCSNYLGQERHAAQELPANRSTVREITRRPAAAFPSGEAVFSRA